MKSGIADHHQSGLSLIEILIAVVVLSIGLLGIANMQTLGIRYNNDSYIRSQAVAYANELMERMRANPDAVNNGAYVDALANVICDALNEPSNATQDCVGAAITDACDVDRMASVDVFRIRCGYFDGPGFQTGVANDLPLGGIEIECDDQDANDTNPCTDTGLRTIRVSWQNPDEKGDANARLQVEIQAQFL